MARRNTRKYKKHRSHKKTKRMIGGEKDIGDPQQEPTVSDVSNSVIPTPEVTETSETPTIAQDTSEKTLDIPIEKDELSEIIERIKNIINENPEFEEYKSKLDNIDLNNIADKSKSIELFKTVEEKLKSLSTSKEESISTTTTTNKQNIPDGMVQILIPKENEHMIKECLIKKGCPVSEYNKDGELITTNA
jgi:hypothetical protein